ncbi:MAG: molybdopterin-dependent oxidoreductase [Lewinellaceae bacterium]|nr:molybdopterin-dependent oxidoreductase [Lewinellaceae bacterium]
MKNIDSNNHVTGRSLYVDDVPVLSGTLYAAVFASPYAHGIVKKVDFEKASRMEGVIRIISHKDIPGQNEIGGIIADEPLLAEKEVHFRGQPVLLVVANSEEAALAAARRVEMEVEPLEVITNPRKAFEKGFLLSGSRTFRLGKAEAVFQSCKYVFEGQAESGGQEHLYLETQGAYAYPLEHGNLRVISSTQGPTVVQRTIAKVLGIGMHHIEVDVTRLGGGFGGKEDQASAWGAMAALAAFLIQKPVKCILNRVDDMRMTGKRHPYSSDYKIGLDENWKIIAYEAVFYQNGGAAADLSPAILERTLFHATSSYFVPNVTVTAHSCKTNLPPNTAFRGFGGPQGMFVMEAAIAHAAQALGVEAFEIQQRNLLQDGDEFPYGQITEGCEAQNCWNEAVGRYDYASLKKEVTAFNEQNRLLKKGIALMPICFGISFTNTPMNNARALVHVYGDGSVGVSTGAVEMGQGVNTKLLQMAAALFGIKPERIKIETTNTTRVANTSPSAASSTTDLNGKALIDAARQIMGQLKDAASVILKEKSVTDFNIKEETVWINGKPTDLEWETLVQQALLQRLNLSAKGHYATPVIHYDKTIEKGHPFAYHVYGTAIFVSTVDCLRGTYTFDSVKVVHDFGASMNPMIDLGQTEGGIVQGLGWMTMEEVVYDASGKLLSNALSTYKIPDIYSVPGNIEVHFLNTPGTDMAAFKSKAVGEPPLLYGIGGWFSLKNAMMAFNPEIKSDFAVAPMTPERVLMQLYGTKI